MGNQLAEYVIRLGAELDNNGLNQLLAMLDTTKLKALGITAAIGAATTAVYKFVESTTKKEFELRELQKKQHKTLENIRAQETALKSMGKTLKEVEKDQSLKAIYKDLVKLNKELEMPSAGHALETVRKLQGAYWRFKSVLSSVVQAVGIKVLNNLEDPMNKITGHLTNWSDWFKKNFNSISAKAGVFISDFAKGVMGIGEGFKAVIDYVDKLPDGVKNAIVKIGGAVAFMQSGPLGKILSGILFGGDVIHDSDNYKWNKQNKKAPKWFEKLGGGYTKNKDEAVVDANGNPVAYQIPLAYEDIWDILYGSEETVNGESKAERIATKIVERLTKAFTHAFDNVDFTVGDLLMGKDGEGGIFGSIKKWVDTHDEEVKKLGASVLDFIVKGINLAGGLSGSAAANVFNAIFGHGTVDEATLNDSGAATSFASSLGLFVNSVITGLNNNKTFAESVKQGLTGGVLGAVLGAVASNITIKKDKDGKLEGVEIDWENSVKGDLEAVGNTMLGIVGAGLNALGDVGGFVFGAIGESLGKINIGSDTAQAGLKSIGTAIEKMAGNDSVMNTVSGAIATWFAGGTFLDGIAVGLAGAYDSARKSALEEMAKGTKFEGADLAELEKQFGGSKEFSEKMFGNLEGIGVKIMTGLWDSICGAALAANGIGSSLMSTLLGTIVKAFGEQSESDVTGAMAESLKGLDGNLIAGGIGSGLGTWLATGNFWSGLAGGLFDTLLSAQNKVDENNSLWDVLSNEASSFWGTILNVWLGPIKKDKNGKEMLDEAGNAIRETEKGLASIVEPLLYGIDQEVIREGKRYKTKKGGIISWLFGFDEHEIDSSGKEIGEAIHQKGIFEGLWDNLWDDGSGGGLKGWIDGVVENLSPELEKLKETISTFFSELWGSIYESMPDSIKTLLDMFGIVDGSAPTLKQNEDGSWTLGRADGKAEAVVNSDVLDVLNHYGIKVSAPDSLFGKEYKGTGLVPKGLEEFAGDNPYVLNNFPQALLSAAQSGNVNALQYLLETFTNAKETGGTKGRAEFSQAFVKYMKGGAENGGVPEGWTPSIQISTEYEKPTNVEVLQPPTQTVPVVYEDAGNGKKEAWGGRIGSQMNGLTVGEDGTEYIIPITKPERAYSLIMQMLGEMGSSATSRIMNGLGLGKSGTNGASMGSLESALSGMVMNNTYNISAPVNINVNSSGGDAKDIGNTVYDLAERHLIKNLMGVSP